VAETDPALAGLKASTVISDQYFVETLGGLVCEWSNGKPHNTPTGDPGGYEGVRVSVMPDATAQWAKYRETYQLDSDTQRYCSSYPPASCYLETLVGSTWVSILMAGLSADVGSADEQFVAAITPYTSKVVDVIAATTQTGPRWYPPAGTTELPEDCEAFITDDALVAALGATIPINHSRPGGGWSQASGAIEDVGSPWCNWLQNGSDAGVGTLSWLPGGEWAVTELMDVATEPSAPEEVAIDGLPAADSAWIRCDAGDDRCVVDMAYGGNWIEAAVNVDESSDGSPVVMADHRAAAINVATTIVATLNAR
jgi:hypothetical protein